MQDAAPAERSAEELSDFGRSAPRGPEWIMHVWSHTRRAVQLEGRKRGRQGREGRKRKRKGRKRAGRGQGGEMASCRKPGRLVRARARARA